MVAENDSVPIERPPRLVRLAFRMSLPIAPKWRPWAIDQIERRYGPEPSDEIRDLTFYVDAGEAGLGGFTRFPRRAMSEQKADKYHALGITPSGEPAFRRSPLVDPHAALERLPQRIWPVLPLVLIALVGAVIAGTVAIAVALL